MIEKFLFIDEAEAQRGCGWWQKELGLTDWDIKIKFVRIWEFGDNLDTVAEVKMCLEHKWADIKMLDSQDTDKRSFMRPHDQEQDIVHELEEILLRRIRAQFKETDDINWSFEQAFNKNANAFVCLRRQAHPVRPWNEYHRRCKACGQLIGFGQAFYGCGSGEIQHDICPSPKIVQRCSRCNQVICFSNPDEQVIRDCDSRSYRHVTCPETNMEKGSDET